ncbi:hypothetical protein EDC01DRAFT_621349 [Geopyxis carbonaria]|nr:hypothetical protein EDC01DRAFT_621349 [Geopyxis carbonaria]
MLSCPSLSPASDHSSSSDIDFCDPRHLTYPSPNSATEPEFDLNNLPKIAGDDDQYSLNENISIKIEDKEFDQFDLEGIVDEVPEGTINPAALFGGFAKRARDDDEESLELDAEDFSDEESVLGETSGNSMLMPPSPPASDLSRRSSVDPSSKPKSKKIKLEVDNTDLELDNIIAEARRRGVDEDVCDDSFLNAFSHSHESHYTPAPTEGSSCCDSDSQDITPAPVVRRGRKQSLTEDPSKTFVCHLCTRRFRRQEHLKRHFRSLHTKDKPFSCSECGKKFSRSDNLSQHARTHGSATIHMSFGESDMMGESCLDEDGPLGIVLVDAAQVSSDIKEKLTSVSEAKKLRRKKKRDE